MPEVSINQESPPAFTVELGEGKTHSVDPLETVSRFRAQGVYDGEGHVAANDDQAVKAAREVFELPSLTYTNAIVVFDAFHRWFAEEFQKKMAWSKTSSTNTGQTRSGLAEMPNSDCGAGSDPEEQSDS